MMESNKLNNLENKKESKIKKFFTKIKPSKRKVIQLYAALLYNAHIKGFISGEIFKKATKNVCVPGLNCYSCPGAIGACPLGSLQNALAESKTKLPTYLLGILLLYMIIFGRTICGWLCPVGLGQELLYKIKTPKLKKSKITKALSYLKYVILAVFVIILPLIYALQTANIPLPAFCKYICPAGTFEGAIALLSNPNNTPFFTMLGGLFTWKFALLVLFIVTSVFVYRVFCRFFCPLGAIYGIFNKLAIIGVKVEKDKCNNCGACVAHCKMDIKTVGDSECIQCGECIDVCHNHAIKWKHIKEKIHHELELERLKDQGIEVSVECEKNDTENINTNSLIKEKKKQRGFKLAFGIILNVILIAALIYANVQKKIYEISDICHVTITLNDGTVYENHNKASLLYFDDDIDSVEAEKLSSYANYEVVKEKLDIIIITNNDISKKIDNIKVAKDQNNKLLKSFVKDAFYPYSVYIDLDNKIQIKENKLITDNEFLATIVTSISGISIGNKIGDLCINKSISIIGSDKEFSVFENRGKITIINFWFTTCTPCVKELPHFNKVYKKYKDEISVIAIHEGALYASDPQGVKDYIDKQFNDFEILFGYDSDSASYYDALGGKDTFPYTIIIDDEGIIRNVIVSSLDEEKLENEILKLLENK